jgi:hypothetical protein
VNSRGSSILLEFNSFRASTNSFLVVRLDDNGLPRLTSFNPCSIRIWLRYNKPLIANSIVERRNLQPEAGIDAQHATKGLVGGGTRCICILHLTTRTLSFNEEGDLALSFLHRQGSAKPTSSVKSSLISSARCSRFQSSRIALDTALTATLALELEIWSVSR